MQNLPQHFEKARFKLCDSYTMGCPPVRGLSYVQMDKHGITILYPVTYISVDLAHHELFLAKVGKCGIKTVNSIQFSR